MHADFLVLYKVRHQRFPKFTWYSVYIYIKKQQNSSSVLKAVYESAYNRYWNRGVFGFQAWVLVIFCSNGICQKKKEQVYSTWQWNSEALKQTHMITKLQLLHDLLCFTKHSFIVKAQKATIHHLTHWTWEKSCKTQDLKLWPETQVCFQFGG